VSLAADGNTITISTSLTPTFTTGLFGSATGTYTTVNASGVTLSNGAKFTTSGINAGGIKMTNLGSGLVTATSTDAITGRQLYNAMQSLSTSVAQQIQTLTDTKMTNFTVSDGQITITQETASVASNVTPVINTYSTLASNLTTTSNSIGYKGGKNISVTAENNVMTIATADDVDFTSVTTGNTKMTTDGVAVGDSTTLAASGLTVGTTTVKSTGVTVGNTQMTTSGVSVGSARMSSDGFSVSGGPSMTKSGIDAAGLAISNIKAGEISATSSQAVTGSQLYETNQAVAQNSDAIKSLSQANSKLNQRINNVGAQSAALASLHPLPFDEDHRMSVSIGGGAYKGSSAAAVGVFFRPTENSMVSLGGAVGNDEVMGNISVSYRFGGESLDSQKPQKMAAKLASLDSENRDLSSQLSVARTRMESQDEKLANQKKKLESQSAVIEEQNKKIDAQEQALEAQKKKLEYQEERLQKLEAIVKTLALVK